MTFLMLFVIVCCCIFAVFSLLVAFDIRNDFIELQEQFLRHIEQDIEFAKVVTNIFDDMFKGGAE